MVSKAARDVADGILDLTWSEMEEMSDKLYDAMVIDEEARDGRVQKALVAWAEATQLRAESADTEADNEALRGESRSVF